MSEVHIGNLVLKKAIIQGGMGVGISCSRLAGAVAHEGGMGVISTAQIGYGDPRFREQPEETNLKTLPVEIKRAKELAQGNGVVAVNIMSVTQLYEDYVKTAIGAGIDAIISGAGLPLELPALAKGTDVKIAPVLSSFKAAKVLLNLWHKKHQSTADFLIVESPYSGGHQGYNRNSLDHLDEINKIFEDDVKKVIELKKTYEEIYQKSIPVFVAGGVFDSVDVSHAMSLGADGVQVGTRFIVTDECDANENYKNAYILATKADLTIIDSPVGMPARVLRNSFVERMMNGSEKITNCYNCLKACDPSTAKYCISEVLIKSANGDTENGLLFCSTNPDRINKIQSVKDVIADLGL
ncbi:MAG: nitronate monooxygenase family protein [Christensenella sp.]|uniref:NAD(P)H-dependent flavin oxidoreductase n=1 Tax=Christensenella sp. TaxID=1935934 RepID=UPI002B202CB8|nr:nitronate monooxygenase family protein [Christensenella sp.]MEA5003482.1 nitronate monooxygenase family protein [Christensenella sp.]